MGENINFETAPHKKLRFATLVYVLVLLAGIVYLFAGGLRGTLADEMIIFGIAIVISVGTATVLLPKDRTEISKRTGGNEIKSAGTDLMKTLCTGGLYLPYYLYNRREKVRHYQESQSRLPEIKSRWESAKEKGSEDDIGAAISDGTDLMDSLEATVSKYTEVNLQEHEELLATVHRSVIEWRMQRANQEFDRARTRASEKNYEEAIAILDDMVEEVGSALIDSFEFTCHDEPFEWNDSKELSNDVVDKLKDGKRYSVLTSENEHQAPILDEFANFVTNAYERRIDWMGNSVDQLLSQAEDESLVDAVETARTAKIKADDTLQLAASAPKPTDVTSFKDPCQRAYDRTLAYEQKIAQERLNAAQEKLDAEQYDESIQFLREVRKRLTDTMEFLERGPRDIDSQPLENLRTEAVQRFVDYEQGRVRSQLETAQDQADSGENREAVETVQMVSEQIDEAIAYVTAAEADIDTIALNNIREEADRRTVDYKLCVERDRLKSAQEAAKQRNYEKAVEIAKEAEEQTREIRALANTAKTEIDRTPITDVHEQSLQLIVDSETVRAEHRLETAQSTADEAKYDEAIDGAGEAKSRVEHFCDNDRFAAADLENVRTLIEHADTCRGEWEQQILIDRIDDTRNSYAPKETRERLQSVLQDLSNAEYICDSATTALRNQAREVYLQSYVRETIAFLEEGTRKLEREKYKEGHETFAEARECLSDALATANEWDISDVSPIESLQITVRKHEAQAATEILETDITRGIDKIEQSSLKEAEETFSTIIEQTANLADTYEENVLPARLEELESVARKNRNAIYKAQSKENDGTQIIHRPSNIVPSRDRNSIGSDSWDHHPTDLQLENTTIDEDSSDTASIDTPVGVGGPPSSVPSPSYLDLGYDTINKKEKIGAGGSGEIYEATVQMENQLYRGALKEPKAEGTLHTDVFDRFQKEAETWSSLDDSDYIVSVIAYGSTPLPWLLLEYMDQGSLEGYTGTMPLDQALWTAQCLADGLSHAHSHGVAHLDLKPENVLLRRTESSAWPVPKIGDWGLVRAMLDDQNEIEGITPAYAAPEQIEPERFGEPDQATDIYQLGVVLYELFAGTLPFDRAEGVSNVVNNEIIPLEEANPEISSGLNDVVMNALQVEKPDRYDHAVYIRDQINELRNQHTAHR